MEEQNKKEENKKQEPELLEGVDEAKALQEELEKISKERDEYLDGWRRSKADLINYKKEELKRLEEMAKFGNEEVIRNLISVLDSFELALVTLEKSEGKVEKGIYLIKTQLEDILKRRGLQKMINLTQAIMKRWATFRRMANPVLLRKRLRLVICYIIKF